MMMMRRREDKKNEEKRFWFISLFSEMYLSYDSFSHQKPRNDSKQAQITEPFSKRSVPFLHIFFGTFVSYTYWGWGRLMDGKKIKTDRYWGPNNCLDPSSHFMNMVGWLTGKK